MRPPSEPDANAGPLQCSNSLEAELGLSPDEDLELFESSDADDAEAAEGLGGDGCLWGAAPSAQGLSSRNSASLELRDACETSSSALALRPSDDARPVSEPQDSLPSKEATASEPASLAEDLQPRKAVRAPLPGRRSRRPKRECLRRAKFLQRAWLCGWVAWLKGLNARVLQGKAAPLSASRRRGGKNGVSLSETQQETPLLQAAALSAYLHFCRQAQQADLAASPFAEAAGDFPKAEELQRLLGQQREALREAKAALDADDASVLSNQASLAEEAECVPADCEAVFCFVASFFQVLKEDRRRHPFFRDSILLCAEEALQRAERLRGLQANAQVVPSGLERETQRVARELQTATSAAEASAVGELSSRRLQSGAFLGGGAAQLILDAKRRRPTIAAFESDCSKREIPSSAFCSASASQLPVPSSRRRAGFFGFSHVLVSALKALQSRTATSACLALVRVRRVVKSRRCLPWPQPTTWHLARVFPLLLVCRRRFSWPSAEPFSWRRASLFCFRRRISACRLAKVGLWLAAGLVMRLEAFREPCAV